jgi:EAL domain-containing protein (putative c-di-GMP-specific phosphodiesterase class I)
MYRAKERGRGCYEVFDTELRRRLTERVSLEADLRHALDAEDDRLWVAFQVIRAVPSGRIWGVESLVRLDHPERGAVPPSDFIPVAEDSGLIGALGERVLRDACRQVARWRESVAPELRLTVNLSVRQVADPALVDTVARALCDSGLPAGALGLEITEGLLLEETPVTTRTLVELKALGVQLVLDDFGTGYSSLSYLQRYPLDALKIDRSFVAALGPQGDGDAAIVQAVIGMARALGLRVIPEGVETDAQLARLHDLGCDLAQGYLLGRPLRADAVAVLLQA